MLLRPEKLRSATGDEIDPRVAQIVARTIAVDMHSHVQIRFAKNPNTDASPDPDLDLTGEMKLADFSAICQTYNLDGIPNVERGEYEKYNLEALAFEDRLLARNRMRRALNMQDLETAHAQKQPILIQSAEGAQFIEGRLERIEEVYKRGLRHLQLVHERDDMVSPLGDVYTAAGPLIISHTGLNSARAYKTNMNGDMQRRLISKEQARAVADAGGVIGVWWRLVPTMKNYVAAVKDMVDAVGIDHVGIGSDTDLLASNVLPYTKKIWPDENGGGNFCRVFAKVTVASHASA